MWESSVMSRVVVVAIIAVSAWRIQATPDCVPSCEALEPGVKIQDPENCQSYYVCLEDELPSDSSIECPTGEYFDFSSQGCSSAKPESCRPCSHCRTRCSDTTNGLIANPMDCSSFLICLLDSLVKANCDEGEFFNGTTCSTDEDSCCNPCLVYCPQEGIEVYDPYDCTRYYLCEEEGVPNDSHHRACPPESPVFDRELHRCGQGDITCLDESNQSSINPCPKGIDTRINWAF